MSTCLDIVRRALLTAEGEREFPAGGDGALAMMRLQDVILSLPLLMDGAWTPVFTDGGAGVEAADGDRIHADDTVAVTLPAGARDLSRVQVIGANEKAGLWIFAAADGAWRRADGLQLSDDSPFAAADDAHLAALLALALAGDAGVAVTAEMIGRAAAALSSFSARFYRPCSAALDPAFTQTSDMGWRQWL